ncbi:hypothetical protein ADUPG1_007228, partial [Aduncisulcus paluster]
HSLYSSSSSFAPSDREIDRILNGGEFTGRPKKFHDEQLTVRMEEERKWIEERRRVEENYQQQLEQEREKLEEERKKLEEARKRELSLNEKMYKLEESLRQYIDQKPKKIESRLHIPIRESSPSPPSSHSSHSIYIEEHLPTAHPPAVQPPTAHPPISHPPISHPPEHQPSISTKVAEVFSVDPMKKENPESLVKKDYPFADGLDNLDIWPILSDEAPMDVISDLDRDIIDMEDDTKHHQDYFGEIEKDPRPISSELPSSTGAACLPMPSKREIRKDIHDGPFHHPKVVIKNSKKLVIDKSLDKSDIYGSISQRPGLEEIVIRIKSRLESMRPLLRKYIDKQNLAIEFGKDLVCIIPPDFYYDGKNVNHFRDSVGFKPGVSWWCCPIPGYGNTKSDAISVEFERALSKSVIETLYSYPMEIICIVWALTCFIAYKFPQYIIPPFEEDPFQPPFKIGEIGIAVKASLHSAPPSTLDGPIERNGVVLLVAQLNPPPDGCDKSAFHDICWIPIPFMRGSKRFCSPKTSLVMCVEETRGGVPRRSWRGIIAEDQANQIKKLVKAMLSSIRYYASVVDKGPYISIHTNTKL